MAGDARGSGRSRRTVERLELSQGDPGTLVASAELLAAAGGGWITLKPVVDADPEAPAPGMVEVLLSTNDPRNRIPLCTWVPGARSRRGDKPDSLGIQHGTGPRVAARLAERGVPIPDGWRKAQDHPRRGLVVVPPDGTSVNQMFAWLLRAGAVLAEDPPTGRWLAEVHHRA